MPLSKAVLDLLRAAEGYRDDSGLVFPSANGKIMRDATLSGLLHSVGVKESVHGMRSSFKTWCSETGQPRELAEAALAHATGNQVEQAYNRADLLEKRRELMSRWSKYLLQP